MRSCRISSIVIHQPYLTSFSHLECISDKGMRLMAEHKSVAILLPTTAWIMHLTPPPARKMIELNVPVAVASDYNPNAYCMSMPFVMNVSSVCRHSAVVVLYLDGHDDERGAGRGNAECGGLAGSQRHVRLAGGGQVRRHADLGRPAVGAPVLSHQ